LQGYLTDPVLARRHAIDLASEQFSAVLAALRDLNPTVVFGLIETDGKDLFNTAVVVRGGRLHGRYRKNRILLAERVFGIGEEWPVFEAGDLRFGINICADTGVPEPAAAVAAMGARLVVCPANNMLPRATAEAWRDRHNEIRARRARENGIWLISSDVTGERDDRVSYGPTAVIDPAGHVVAQLPLTQVGVLCAEIPL
jgi:predicted amidohydrolase